MQIYTVFLEGETMRPEKTFRCEALYMGHRCNGIVFKHFSAYTKIIEAAIDIVDVSKAKPVDHICRRCKTIYRIL